MVVSGGGYSRYLATVKFVEEIDNLLSSFNGGQHFEPGKTLCYTRSGKSLDIDYWTKTTVGVSSCPL
jgi:hypothetical protein